MLTAFTMNPYADLIEPGLDSNTAFFPGQTQSYVLAPPSGFRLDTDGAAREGYSLAFIPDQQDYYEADIAIAATFLTEPDTDANIPFTRTVEADTASISEYYGPFTEIWPVDSMFNASGEIVPTVYVNNDSSFIPTVLVSYYDGGTEMLILELIISDTQPRFRAEAVFEEMLLRFKVLKNASPDAVEQIGVAEPH